MLRLMMIAGSVLAAAAGLAGCGDEGTCDETCPVGNGFTCYAGVCIPHYDPPTDGGTDQVDVPDATDTHDVRPDADAAACEAGPGSHDEDGDGVADVCDNCPEVANAGQSDADGDGIGDACEYPGNPSQVGERVAFYSMAESPGWRSEGGTWWRHDDALGQDDTRNSAIAYGEGWTFGNDMMVRAVASWEGTTDPVYALVGVLTRVQRNTMGPTSWFLCCGNQISDTVQIWSYVAGGYNLLSEQPLAFHPADGMPVRIVGSAFGNTLRCVVEREDGSVAGSAEAEADGAISGGPGVRTYGSAAVFSSVTIYR